jgi:SAM-dependent methyltransferase
VDSRFTSEQYVSAYPDGGEYHWWPLARNRVVQRVIVNGAKKNPRILDIGCGRGVVVKSLREAGFNCEGVEPSAVQPLAGVSGYVRSGLHAFDLPASERERYDTVLLLDVIEHLPDPFELLGRLTGSFPALSTVIVTVPARQELWSSYDEYFGHYRRYSMPMLLELATRLGWEIRHMQYFFHALYLPAWVLAGVGARRQTSIRPPRGVFKYLHRLVALGMSIDALLLPRRVVGTSLIVSFQVGR